MKEISRVWFNALAAYCRDPLVTLFGIEMRWFESPDGRLLATLILDGDEQFSAIFLARDLRERFRWVGQTAFFDSHEPALLAMDEEAEQLLLSLDEIRVQGDDASPAIDFFEFTRAEKDLDERFITLATSEGFSPARNIIENMMRWYEDADGNFVEQFQTSGFDPRIWELYLFATLSEVGFALDRTFNTPDFTASGLPGEICLEATTINPTRDDSGKIVPPPPTDTPEQARDYFGEYIPIRYAGPLTNKLGKRYWAAPNVRGKPFAIAIHDFHAPMSMVWTRSGFPTYLYGYAHDASRDENGTLRITPRKIEKHKWGTKEIPSGFFDLPEAENISAIVFNNGATLSKFNRMGVIAGFGSKSLRLIRQGTAVDPDPNASEPRGFVLEVDPATYQESWIEGMDVFHNPAAVHPIDPELFPGAAHHILRDDKQIESIIPEWHPLGSITHVIVSK